MKRMADGGVKSLGFITDPWGTYIELNEGFSEIP